MNGPTARKIEVPLSFLGQGDYRALLVRDHKDEPVAVEIERATRRRGESLGIEMRDGGGFIARFYRG